METDTPITVEEWCAMVDRITDHQRERDDPHIPFATKVWMLSVAQHLEQRS